MNESEIEQLLRQAPRPTPPPSLLPGLQAEINLPRPSAAHPAVGNPRPSWFSRWMPALAFGALFLGGFIVLGMQAGVLAELRRENAELRAALAELEPLRATNVSYQQLSAEVREIDRLRADSAEVTRLRAEVQSLQAQLPEITRLRTENQKLQAANQARAQAGGPVGEDFLAQAREKAEMVRCVNNLKQIGLAGRIWANDNNDTYPPDFLSMTNEMSTPVILQCPADHSRNVTNWAAVASGNVSYQLLAPGLRMKDEPNPSIVFALCPLHHNLCLVDGSVQHLSAEGFANHVKTVNGRMVMQ